MTGFCKSNKIHVFLSNILNGVSGSIGEKNELTNKTDSLTQLEPESV